MMPCTCVPSAWEAETSGYLGLADQRSSLFSEFQVSERFCLKKTSWVASEDDTGGWPLVSIYTYMYTYVRTHMQYISYIFKSMYIFIYNIIKYLSIYKDRMLCDIQLINYICN